MTNFDPRNCVMQHIFNNRMHSNINTATNKHFDVVRQTDPSPALRSIPVVYPVIKIQSNMFPQSLL